MQADPEVAARARGLADAAFSAVRWTLVSRAAVETLALGTSIALARLVPPADFGRATLALVAVTVPPALLGSLAATDVVRRPAVSGDELRAAALLGIVGGFALSVLALLVLAPLAGMLFDERTADLMRLASPAPLLAGLAAVPTARLQRDLRFEALSRITIVATFVATPLTLLLAALGLDGIALVIGPLAASVVGLAGLLVAGVWTAPAWRPDALRPLLAYGLPAAGSSIPYQLFRNVDYLLIGARLGVAQVGLYWRAFQLGAEYQRKITAVMTNVALPLYARTRDAAHMLEVRTRMVRSQATIVFPLLGMLIAAAPVLVPFVYGPAWAPAVVPTQILAVGGMVAAVLAGLGPFVLAAGRPRRLMVVSWANVALLAAVMYVTAPYGIVPASIGLVAVAFATLIGNYVFLLRGLDAPLRTLAVDAGAAALATTALVAVAYPSVMALDAADVPPPLVLVGALAGVPVYVGAIRRLSRPAWDDVVLLVRRTLRMPQGAAAPPALDAA